jgi:hypothetical protein
VREAFQTAFEFDEVAHPPAAEETVARKLEADLYAPVANVLREWWVPKEDVSDYILEITANQGRRSTGGLWTRPDIVCVSACAYPYLPGRSLDLTTFEIKKTIAEGVAGVFEAAAQSVFAHRSCLIVRGVSPAQMANEPDFPRVESECKRFGIGLILFFDPDDWQTFETIVEPRFNNPPPVQVNRFLATQLSEVSRQRLLTMFR